LSLRAINYDRETLVSVLVYHWRTETSACGCGWGREPQHLGLSHADHVANVYEQSVLAKLTPTEGEAA
jgi:hypothetical protein